LRYPQPSPDAGRDDPATLDRGRGDIVLDRALFREMRATGRWPLLLNIKSREVALIAPGGEVARRLKLRPPASGDRVLHLVPSPPAATATRTGCVSCSTTSGSRGSSSSTARSAASPQSAAQSAPRTRPLHDPRRPDRATRQRADRAPRGQGVTARFGSVDDYIDALPPALAEVARAAGEAIDGGLPQAESAIKWAQPTWSLG